MALGTNDAVRPPYPHHVPLSQYRANLISILTHHSLLAHKSSSLRLILVTPAPLHECQSLETDLKKGFEGARRAEGSTALYAQAVRDVGGELGVPVLDLWKLVDEDSRQNCQGIQSENNERFRGYFTDGKTPSYMYCFPELDALKSRRVNRGRFSDLHVSRRPL